MVTEVGTLGHQPDGTFRPDATDGAWSRDECLALERGLVGGGQRAEELRDQLLVRRFEAVDASSADVLASVLDGFVDFGERVAVLDNLELMDQLDARHGCPAAGANEEHILADVPS